MEFRCTKCGSLNMEIENKGSQTGLYCCDCGKWNKWLTKEEVRMFNSMNHAAETKSKDKCVVIESDIPKSFEDSMNKYLNDGYKVESSSCNSKFYKAILILDEN